MSFSEVERVISEKYWKETLGKYLEISWECLCKAEDCCSRVEVSDRNVGF